MQAFTDAGLATDHLEDALLNIELVASRPVYEAAHELWKLAKTLSETRLQWGSKPPEVQMLVDEWSKVQQAEFGLEKGRMRLREAIRQELMLDLEQ
jgi:hypothetical protein